jgi:hypothetical protein
MPPGMDGDRWHGLPRMSNGEDGLCQKGKQRGMRRGVECGRGAGRAWQISWGMGVGSQPVIEKEKMEMWWPDPSHAGSRSYEAVADLTRSRRAFINMHTYPSLDTHYCDNIEYYSIWFGNCLLRRHAVHTVKTPAVLAIVPGDPGWGWPQPDLGMASRLVGNGSLVSDSQKPMATH